MAVIEEEDDSRGIIRKLKKCMLVNAEVLVPFKSRVIQNSTSKWLLNCSCKEDLNELIVGGIAIKLIFCHQVSNDQKLSNQHDFEAFG